MTTITKEYRAEIAHRLQNHPGKCRNIHGHSYKFEIEIRGPINTKTGMIIDFHDLKSMIDAVIGKWDHALLLEFTDPLCAILGGTHGVNMIAVPSAPTAEWMCNNIAEQLMGLLATQNIVQDYTLERVRVWETTTAYAEWSGRCAC